MLIIMDTPIIAGIDEVVQKLRQEAYTKFGIDYFGKGLHSGNNVQYKCPFHKDGQESRPSFGIRIDNGLYNCLTCTDGGDLPELIARVLKLGEPIKPLLGYKWLLSKFNLAIVGERPDIDLDISREVKKASFVEQEELDEYLQWTHPYMENERFIRQSTQDFLEIGYDDKTQSVVFIMRDLRGVPLYIKKRPINPFNDARYINKKDVMKKNVMFGLWHVHKHKNLKPNPKFIDKINKYGLFIPEGEIDSCSFWESGVAGASIGGKIFFDTQVRLVQKVAPPFTVLAFDNDEEGFKELSRVSQEYEHLIKFKYAQYPSWCKDMNDLIKDGKGVESLKIFNSLEDMVRVFK